jgi:uncharacterized protein (TIGR03083 family)
VLSSDCDDERMTETTQQTILSQILIDADRFGAVVVAGGSWDAASPCENWTAADVLDHVISTERDFLTTHHADLGDEPQGTPADRWLTHWSRVRLVLTPELLAQEFDGAFGRTTVGAALSTFYGLDLLVHRWDLGVALGQRISFSDEELDRIEAALDVVGENIYTYGASKPALAVQPGDSRQTVLLARVGRKG